MTDRFDVVRLTAKGQMTVPIRARKKLGLKHGDHLAVYVRDDELVLRKLAPLKRATEGDAVFALVGRWQGPSDLAEAHDQHMADIVAEEAEGTRQ